MQHEQKLETSSFGNKMKSECMLLGKKGVVAHANFVVVLALWNSWQSWNICGTLANTHVIGVGKRYDPISQT